MTFVNCSNHPCKDWQESQLAAAGIWGNVKDYAFPEVHPDMTEEEITKLAQRTVKEIMKLKPTVVMCQGEFTLTYAIVNLLKALDIKVVAACSERKVIEKKQEDGTTAKTSIFQFKKFRFF